jgi:hypothetical protein
MAEKVGGSGNEWLPGIIAIVAAAFLGGAVPIGLYFGLYQPKVKERTAAEAEVQNLKVQEEALLARQTRVKGLEDDAVKMAERLVEIEEPFASPDVERLDVPEVRARLLRLAAKHKLAKLPEREQELGSAIVFEGKQRITFPKGLQATKLIIETQAFYHDFGRFLTEMETLRDETDPEKPKYVIIPEKLICKGDPNGGSRHVFVLHVFVVEKRNIDAIGR